MDVDDKFLELKVRLNNESIKYRRLARVHTTLMFLMYSICILSSLASAILVASGALPNMFLASLTALPGAAILCTTVFRFKEHSEWHYLKTRRLENFLYQLEYEGVPISEVSKMVREFHEAMESSWPSFGRFNTEESTEDRKGKVVNTAG
ncbi:hypothetical protein [Pseudoalteromonas rhizosphaerae]|uniref:hypothetical protein n=1 Tax=Pseudoalteromonas rhizosphaerae TaxID=2518973 RepID=UPI001230FE52|nr:hypothetical protein [Pseudoalteromonas rhizosphaerae]